jgi:hypothetical protein
MASLCKTCQSIPFKNLPMIPEGVRQCTPEYSVNIHQLNQYDPDEALSVGWTHSKCLAEMVADSDECALCKLFSDARVQLARDYAAAKDVDNFVKYDESRGLADSQMELLARPDGGDGFAVIVRAKNPAYWFVVTAIGLCVDEGKDNSYI